MKHLTKLLVAALLILSGFSTIKPESLVHKVFIYEKSNIDGSNKGQIAVYYQEKDQIEAFKWHDGNQYATIVRAWMNQGDHTVQRFEALRTDHLGNEHLNGVLEVAEDRTVNIQFGDQQQVFQSAPSQWHSYDFDFSSLGYAFQHIHNNNQPISFNILDIDRSQSPPTWWAPQHYPEQHEQQLRCQHSSEVAFGCSHHHHSPRSHLHETRRQP